MEIIYVYFKVAFSDEVFSAELGYYLIGRYRFIYGNAPTTELEHSGLNYNIESSCTDLSIPTKRYYSANYANTSTQFHYKPSWSVYIR